MKVTVAGAGIIGLCSAYYLHKVGYEVQVVDKGNFSDNCSHGNAGLIVPSHIIPLATRATIKQGIKWMFKSASPFYFKPRLNMDLVLWSWRFFRSSHPSLVNAAMPVLRDFSNLSRELYNIMITEEGFNIFLKNRGLLMLYKTAESEAEELEVVEKVHRLGLDAQILNPSQLAELDPYTVYDVRGGIYYPNDAHLNPGQLMDCLRKLLKAKGVHFIENFGISDFEITGNRITALKNGHRKIEVDQMVAAAGAHTAQLLKAAGVKLLIQGGKGYSFTIKKPKHCPSIPAILLEERVAVTPLEEELRIAGTMEISGMDSKIRMHKVSRINMAFKQYYPQTDSGEVQQEDVWFGLRPCSFDGLPYIGKIDPFKNVTIATGHAMLGLSLGAATGKLVSEIVSGSKPSLDISPFNPAR